MIGIEILVVNLKLFIFSAKNVSRLLGYLKIGQKHLYLYDDKTNPYEGTFICLLDFYVHYQSQGRGTGTRLFNFMLENECIESPSQVNY